MVGKSHLIMTDLPTYKKCFLLHVVLVLNKSIVIFSNLSRHRTMRAIPGRDGCTIAAVRQRLQMPRRLARQQRGRGRGRGRRGRRAAVAQRRHAAHARIRALLALTLLLFHSANIEITIVIEYRHSSYRIRR